MALPPGLLPDSSDAKPSRAPLLLGVVVFGALLALGTVLVQNRRLTVERDEAREELAKAAKRPVDPAPPPEPVAAPVPPTPAVVTLQTAPAPPSPPKAPAVRVQSSREEEPPYLTRGLHEFRSGRYDQAERQFFRAFPESLLYLSLTSFAQHNWKEAFAFLSRAMGVDPKWLHKVNPRDLFGKEADFDALLAALDEQIAKNPIDADLKTLAAYVRFHEKGAPYAKALLIEATNLNPDHEAAKAFLEALGP